MAEGYLKHRLQAMNSNIKVESAGVNALVDKEAVAEAQEVARNEGFDISGHKARQLSNEIIADADLILVMEDEQKEFIERKFPHARGRIFLVGQWAGGFEIPDPYRQPLSSFEYAFGLIKKGCDEWLLKIT